jgi:hypothetical protein
MYLLLNNINKIGVGGGGWQPNLFHRPPFHSLELCVRCCRKIQCSLPCWKSSYEAFSAGKIGFWGLRAMRGLEEQFSNIIDYL